jgi:PAS domain-containing protein
VRDKARLACRPVRYVTDRTDRSAGELVDPERRGELVEELSSLAELILEQIADAVIYADDTGTIMRWNRAAAALFGYSAPEALGQNLDLIIPEHLIVLFLALARAGLIAAPLNPATRWTSCAASSRISRLVRSSPAVGTERW